MTTVIILLMSAGVLYFAYWATKRTLAQDSSSKKTRGVRHRR